jgi:hypothetical protein
MEECPEESKIDRRVEE